ncbi:MAG: HAD family hydrolase [Promethearchaeota archaeon]
MVFERAIKAILFDLDGTLVKFPSIWEFFDDLLVQALIEFRVHVPPKATRTVIWHSGSEFETVLREWGVENYPAFIEYFDELDYKLRKKLIENGTIQLFEDVDVLGALQERFKLGILTNTPPEIAWLEIKAFQLERFFDDFVMLGTVEQNIAKPEPEGFLRCLNNLEAQPQEAVMVGDSSSDIIGGNQVGMITVLVDRPNQNTPINLQPPPDLIITDLNGLLQFRSVRD